MTKFIITNYKYNIKYDLNYDTFSNFIQSLKESKKYYYDLCKKNNINTTDFDYQYIKNIDILQGELFKYYILLTNNKNSQKYIILNDDIRNFYNFMIKQLKKSSQYCYILHHLFEDEQVCNLNRLYEYYYDNDIIDMYLLEGDSEFMLNIDINYLTRDNLYRLLYIYACNVNRYEYFRKGYLNKFNINNKLIPSSNPSLKISCYNTAKEFDDSLNKYLDSLNYDTKYDRKFKKIVDNLFDISLSNIKNEIEYIPID
jgi:hypothetical protein